MVKAIQRIGALSGTLRPDAARSGNDVRVDELQDVTQLQLFARKGKGDAFAKAIARFLKRKTPLAPLEGRAHGGIFICAVGPREYWALAQGPALAKNLGALEKAADGHASVFDQTDGRFVVRLSGAHAADVLARGTSLDLHDPAMPQEWGSHAQIEHMPALVLRRTFNKKVVYDVSVPRSYAGSFVTWLR